jgi:hypothetical protein
VTRARGLPLKPGLSALGVGLALVIAELVYRALLFGDAPAFERWRDPGLYADALDDDAYWKLAYRFGRQDRPPREPHPLLGWVGEFDRATLRHHREDRVGGRRPVLLYGDSFARCVGNVECFEDILNADPRFARGHYLLNYGVGGYGLDQIALLLAHSHRLYQRPFVVLSFTTIDFDRSLFTARGGQKPYYEVTAAGDLVLRGVPVDPDPARFFREHPPVVTSYLFRRLLHAPRVPRRVRDVVTGARALTARKIAVNERILASAFRELRDAGVPFLVVVFQYVQRDGREFDVEREDNWRDRLARETLHRHRVPYVWSKALIRSDGDYRVRPLSHYMQEDTGHPTTVLNRLVAREILGAVSAR